LLAESVRVYPVLYNKGDKFFKDVNKKTLAWEDMAKRNGFPSGNLQTHMLASLLFHQKKTTKIWPGPLFVPLSLPKLKF